MVSQPAAQLDLLGFGCRLAGNARILDLPAQWSTGSAILRVSGHLQRLRE